MQYPPLCKLSNVIILIEPRFLTRTFTPRIAHPLKSILLIFTENEYTKTDKTNKLPN